MKFEQSLNGYGKEQEWCESPSGADVSSHATLSLHVRTPCVITKALLQHQHNWNFGQVSDNNSGKVCLCV